MSRKKPTDRPRATPAGRPEAKSGERVPRIYTRTGDDGTTGLASGKRVGKDAPRIEAYGTVDELSSQLGVALAVGLDRRIEAPLIAIQNQLFDLGALLAEAATSEDPRAGERLWARSTGALEALCDELSAELPRLRNFILPGGSIGSSQLHVARTVCRRAERALVALGRLEPVPAEVVHYLNRLSDCLFVMARWENHSRGKGDVIWNRRSVSP